MQANILCEPIPYNTYCVDSFKLTIDKDAFKSVSIPDTFMLIDSDTGECINDFKKNSLEIKYKNHKIHIANITKNLKQGIIEKVQIYFASKVSANYFYGTKKQDVIEILEFIKLKKWLDFDDVEHVYKMIFVKDLDIKVDMDFSKMSKQDILDYNDSLYSRFNGNSNDCHNFKSKEQGIGIQTYERAKASLSKPFSKFYHKSGEIKRDMKFYFSLSDDVRNDIDNKFIYRYEFTLKDNTYFKKYGISNRLEDVFNVDQITWKKIGRDFLDINFEIKIKPPKDLSKIKPIEKTMLLQMSLLIKKGSSIYDIRRTYVRPDDNRDTRYNMSKIFQRIYHFYTKDDSNVKEILKQHETISKIENIIKHII